MWSSTVVHTPVRAGEVVPYVVAYVDVTDGPRVLVRLEGAEALPLGVTVDLVEGDDHQLGARLALDGVVA